MSTQPEALRLAAELEACPSINYKTHAAELRRLHEECNDLARQLNESNERNGRLIAQRDALLEALEVVLNDLMYRDHAEVINFARAAIKSVNAEPVQEPEWEVRADGKRVRTDRWQIGIRRIVALLWGNQREFEIDELVEAVHRLHAQRDTLMEALTLIANTDPVDAALDPQRAVRVARAAIKAVEGK